MVFCLLPDTRDDEDDDVFTDEPSTSTLELSGSDDGKSAKQRSQSLSALPKDKDSPKKVGFYFNTSISILC